MTRYVSAAVAAALLILASPASAQPRLTLPEGKQFSLGEIYRGDVVTHDLLIRNSGTDTLVIQQVNAACGCTGTMLSTDRIPPGGTGTVRVTFNSKNFSGRVHKSLTITSNTPGNESTVTVEFDANVIDEIVLQPREFWFQDAEVGTPSRMTIMIRNGGKTPFTLTKYKSALKGLSLALPGTPIAPGRSADLAAEFLPAEPVPILAEWVFIETDNPRQSQISLPVYGNVKPRKAK